MSGGDTGAPVQQPDSFSFTESNLAEVQKIIAKYPEGRTRSAVMPMLDLAQRQEGWVSQPAIEEIARIAGVAPMRVLEVATFYTMYRLKPVGTHFIEVCTNLPCWLRGSDDVVRAAKDVFGVDIGGTSEDGKATVAEAECLGACVNAPMCQIGDHYYEDLTYENAKALFETLKAGGTPKPGPQNSRTSSEPEGGPTTLTDVPPHVPYQPQAAPAADATEGA
ncbi:MAG: NADH-quinone oxidoreductase subunit NuoE [Rhodospirillaceae bacterium]